MSRVVFLDTAPLSLLTNPRLPVATQQALRWSIDLLAAGYRLLVPAIADFELRRELERQGNLRSLEVLDAFNAATPDRYLFLTDESLKCAARLWGQARNQGTLPGDPKELNGDILIAAQVLEYQALNGLVPMDLVVATVNVGHLSLFVPAAPWQDIVP